MEDARLTVSIELNLLFSYCHSVLGTETVSWRTITELYSNASLIV